jgi:hypothetical protein
MISATRKPLILNGEMSEWLKEHAWKMNLAARYSAQQHNDVLRYASIFDWVFGAI